MNAHKVNDPMQVTKKTMGIKNLKSELIEILIDIMQEYLEELNCKGPVHRNPPQFCLY